jgi:hypothetical protein
VTWIALATTLRKNWYMEILLFILRLAVLGALYGFLGAVLWLIWREFHWLSMSTASRVVQPEAMGLRIIEGGETGLRAGQVLPLEQSTTLGRLPDNGIVLRDTSVSARHAILAYENGCWWIQDMNSTNGTYLNGDPVLRKLPLRSNDVLTLGQVRLHLEDDANSNGGTR